MEDQPENSELEPAVFSISLEQDGKLTLTRRDFLAMALTVGGAVMLASCQAARFIQGTPLPTPTQRPTSTPLPTPLPSSTPTPELPTAKLYAEMDVKSEVTGTLHHNDIVMLISDRPEEGWVRVLAPGSGSGWLRRSLVDFTRAHIRDHENDAYLPIPTDTPIGLLYLVVVLPGGPEPILPVTCPLYDGMTSLLQPTLYTPEPIPTFYYQPPPSIPCACVGYSGCACVGYTSCACVTYIPCPCVAHRSCTCLTYMPCACVSYIPCACLAYNPCGCLAFNPCGCVSYFPCVAT